MIVLTEQQQQELTKVESPQIFDPATGKTYVLVQSEVFERFKNVLEDEITVTGEMVDRLMADEDRHDPALDFYQLQYGRKS